MNMNEENCESSQQSCPCGRKHKTITNANDPAFPQVIPVMGNSAQIQGAYEKLGEQYIPGLTKREWLAGMAMQGIIANGSADRGVKEAVAWADSLLAKLEKSK